MKILIVSSEVAPFSKTGGLADVSGALPGALAALGHDVRVVTPLYSSVDRERFHLLPVMRELDVFIGQNRFSGQVFRTTLGETSVPVYFVQCDELFDRPGLYGEGGEAYSDNSTRFAFFCLAAIWMLKGLDWAPDVIQANDWQAALIPTYLKNWPILSSDPFYRRIRVVQTIHNLAYQGDAEPAAITDLGLDWELFTSDGLEFYDRVNLLKGGLVFSDHLTTVSPTYALEIQTPVHGCGLEGILANRAESLTGILNGIDDALWDPASDPHLESNFSARDRGGKAACKAALQRRLGLKESPGTPLIGMISRLADQKGFDLVEEVLDGYLEGDVQCVVLGTGDRWRETWLRELSGRLPEQVSATLTFDESLAHQIEAGADLFLMPSRFEPCGLNQMYSMRYGTVPVVRATGGLVDTVIPATAANLKAKTATGFVFEEASGHALGIALDEALKTFNDRPGDWQKIVEAGMRRDFSWKASAQLYADLFHRLITRED